MGLQFTGFHSFTLVEYEDLPRKTMDPKTKHETLLLILHYFEEEDMMQCAQTLRDEISARKQGATPAQYFNQLRKLISNGEWKEAHALVKQITRKRNGKLFRYLLRKQEYLELLDRQESQKAFGFLTKRLKPLEQISRRLDPKEFDDLCYLVTCTSVQTVPRYKFWQPQNAREELSCVLLRNIDLDRRFEVEIEEEDVPPRRLKTLLERHAQSHHSLLSDRDDTKTISSLPTRMYSSFIPKQPSLSMKCVCVTSSYVVAGTSNHHVTFWPRRRKELFDKDADDEKKKDGDTMKNTDAIEMPGHTSRIWCLDSQTNQDKEFDIVASGSGDGTVRFWTANHHEEKISCARIISFVDDDDSEKSSLSDIYAVRLQSDGRMCGAGGLSGVAHLVDVESGKRVVRLEGHTAAVTGLCFARQTSNMVVTSSNDTSIRLWDILSGSCVQKLPHVAEITSVSSSGNYILTASSDNAHRIWDVRTFRFVTRLTGHENTSKNFVRAVFGPNEKYVASGSQDGFV